MLDSTALLRERRLEVRLFSILAALARRSPASQLKVSLIILIFAVEQLANLRDGTQPEIHR